MTNKPLSSKRELRMEMLTALINGDGGTRKSFLDFIEQEEKEAVESEWRLLDLLFKSWGIDGDVVKSFVVQRDNIFGRFEDGA